MHYFRYYYIQQVQISKQPHPHISVIKTCQLHAIMWLLPALQAIPYEEGVYTRGHKTHSFKHGSG